MTADSAADIDDDEGRMKAATSPGNLDLVLRILAAMCDGQYTELQASDVTNHVTTLVKQPIIEATRSRDVYVVCMSPTFLTRRFQVYYFSSSSALPGGHP